MKKFALGSAALLMAGCMLVCFAGCGTVSKAKSMKGEEVTEDVWNSAMAATALEKGGTASALAAQAEGEQPSANFKGEFQVKMDLTMSANEMELTTKFDLSSSVVVADEIVHITFDYDVSVDGSEELMGSLGEDDATSEKGTLEIYISYGETKAVYLLGDDGNWAVIGTDLGDIDLGVGSTVGEMPSAFMEMLDQSALAGAFSKYTYSAEKKGYVLLDVSASDDISLGEGEESAVGGALDLELVYKIRDGKLAAIYAESSTEGSWLGALQFGGSTELGLVYTYGGQSNTLPTVA